MKLKLYAVMGLALFLFVAYFFISHAYVFMRLTTVFGFMAFVALAVIVIAVLGRLFK